MKRPSLAVLILCSILSSACSKLYTLDPEANADAITRDQWASTQTVDGVTVTVGPLRSLTGAEMHLGILVSNMSGKEIQTEFNDAKFILNGAETAPRTVESLKKTADFVRKADAVSAGLMAGSRAMSSAQSGSFSAASWDKVAVPSISEAAVRLNMSVAQANEKFGKSEATRLGLANSFLWEDTFRLRQQMAQNYALSVQHYWRSETVPHEARIFRVIWAVKPPDDHFGGKDGEVGLQLRIGERAFAYRFRAVARSLSEADTEFYKRNARVGQHQKSLPEKPQQE